MLKIVRPDLDPVGIVESHEGADEPPDDGGHEPVVQVPAEVGSEPLEPDDAEQQREEEDGGQQRKHEAGDLGEVVLHEGRAEVGVKGLIHHRCCCHC